MSAPPLATGGAGRPHVVGGCGLAEQGISAQLRHHGAVAWSQTVEEVLADHLPATADPRLRRVTLKQLLAMTSGLAGDDGSLSGDDQLWDHMFQSRDWVRHILSRRLVSSPGAEFAYSSASSHLLSAVVADATGQSTLAFARAKLFDPWASPPTTLWSRRSGTGR